MASSIDPSQPPQGQATTAPVRANFQAAKDEIEGLQNVNDTQDTDIGAIQAEQITQNNSIGGNAANISNNQDDIQTNKNDITTINGEQTVQDGRLDALEAAPAAPRIWYGQVDASTGALINSTGGFSVNVPSVGVYDYTFDTPEPDTAYNVQVSPITSGVNSYLVRAIAVTGFQVQCFNSANAPAARAQHCLITRLASAVP